MRVKKRPSKNESALRKQVTGKMFSSDPAASSKNTNALSKQVDGEIFVPVCEPEPLNKYCCLCGQNGKDVQFGCSVPPDYGQNGAKDQQVEIEGLLLLVCDICYRAVGKYHSPLTVREMLEHSFACGHAPGALNKFFKECYHTSTFT